MYTERLWVPTESQVVDQSSHQRETHQTRVCKITSVAIRKSEKVVIGKVESQSQVGAVHPIGAIPYISSLQCALKSPGARYNMASNSVHLRWGLRLCISNELP